MQLLLDYPWYYLLFCLLAGAAYSFILYRKTSKSPDSETSLSWRLPMALLRFVAVSLIAFLLLAPLVKRHVNTHEKPIVVLAEDVSESVQPFDYSQFDIHDSKFDIVLDSFGGKTTDIATALQDIADRYAGRNLGAVILASDGIYNQGANPTNAATQIAVPVYTVALGDTTHHPDANITHLRYNHVAYLGNQFPLEVTVRAHRLKGQRGTLAVTHNGRRLHSQEIAYTDNNFTTTETITLDADHAGLQSYTITLTGATTVTRTIAIEVIDGHQKIALVAAAAHPDIAALRRAIEKNPNYEIEVIDKADFANRKLGEYSLLILHNLPDSRFQLPTAALQTPTIFVVGTQTDLARFNALHSGLEIVAKARKTDEVTAAHNGTFALFNFDEESARRLEQMPPLTAPFGTYRPAANLQSLFTAKIGNLPSDRPMVAFCQQEGTRRAFVVGEGLWRWRLQDYQMTGSHDDFDQLVEKMVVYTSLQTNKERLHVTTRHIYRAGENVVVEAELYDDNYEPVNTPDVTLELYGQTPVSAPTTFTFNRTAGGYSLPLGTLEPGHYAYTATTTLAGKRHTASGNFIVEDVNLEQANHVADHALLNTIAQTTGAQMLYPDQFDQLPQLLAQRDDLKSVVYAHTRYTELLNLPLILILLIILLAAEWTLRKLKGEN
jgi:hypothetical protein